MPKKKKKCSWLRDANEQKQNDTSLKPVTKKRINTPIPINLVTAGYKLVESPSREYWQSPGGRKYVPYTDRFAKSCLKNKVKGSICKSRKQLKWSGIGLSPKKSKRVGKVSKHTTRTMIPVGKENTRHITSINDFRQFMQDLSAT